MGANLQAVGLAKRYGAAAAVAGVALEAKPGEFVSLLGPSGCGKTTSLRLIAGLERPDAGRILLDGRDVTDLPAQRRGIGMVFQQYALFPNLSAAENIAFALRVRRRPPSEVDRRVRELLALVHLEEAADRFPHQLSGGMQQRVALARALAMAPPLLLLDEPLSALDAAIRDELRTELRRLQRRLDLTVLYVTHDQAEAMALSDRIVVMDKGTVSQVGTPRELYDQPATRFAAAFVGVSNRRQTTVEATAGRAVVRWGSALLTVSPNGSLSAGTAVTASWRPEDGAIADLADGNAGGNTDADANANAGDAADSNALRGQIELVTFLGPITRLDIRVDGDPEPVLVDLASAAARDLVTGQAVAVRVPPASIRLYP
ncbi:MAG: ABC transporter ATP-binding protein [Chloroflexia bacterium]|nr:ABC transporter ATP-binding protein [Chloroflexia bacterium]